MNVFANKYINI